MEAPLADLCDKLIRFVQALQPNPARLLEEYGFHKSVASRTRAVHGRRPRVDGMGKALVSRRESSGLSFQVVITHSPFFFPLLPVSCHALPPTAALLQAIGRHARCGGN